MEQKEQPGFAARVWSNVFRELSLKQDDKDPLRNIFPISSLSAKERMHLMEIAHLRKYETDEFIFCQGDPGIGLYLMYSGNVKIVVETPEKGKVEIASFGSGDFFGELALLDGEPRSASAIATKDSIIYIIFKHDFDEFITRFPKVGLSLMTGITQVVVARMRQMNNEYAALFEQLQKLRQL